MIVVSSFFVSTCKYKKKTLDYCPLFSVFSFFICAAQWHGVNVDDDDCFDYTG